MGCCSNMSLACASPVIARPTAETSMTPRPNRVIGRNIWASSSASGSPRRIPRTIHQPPIAATKVPPVSQAPNTVCGNAAKVVELVSTSQMLVSSARLVSGL
ncbi:hypothetical protein TPAU25S_01098 [Tsukamurella paurometabola]|nr:Uncharacterised protein [Tsukamurella paurometabola]